MDLSHLNPPQREAVLATEGPVLVLAGAGSGKTRVITHRIAHLLDRKVPASAILAVTFTNKTAVEMKERAVHLAGKRAEGVTLCTFHAFGAEVVRAYARDLGLPGRFAIADMGDQLSILKRAMRERRVDDRAFDARRVLSLISRAKNQLRPPGRRPERELDDYELIAAEVFPLYERALRAQGAVDFDDLLLLPARLFRERPEVHAAYVERIRYVMVDEFQDTNRAQMELLLLLAGEAKNVCAVGDDDQSIYAWRGADVSNVLEFERHFPGAKVIRLEQNYRSTQAVLEAANSVIARNPNRRPKRMWTERLGGERVQLVIAPTEEDEARYVAREVARTLAEGMPADEIAVLYRTSAQSRPIEEALRERAVLYEVIGGSEFFDRREVRDVIAYFKVIANSRDEVSLLRIVNVPARGIGDVTMERLVAAAQKSGRSVWDTMRDAGSVDLPRGAAEKVQEFCSLVERYRAQFRRGNLAEVTRRLLEEIGFKEAARAQSSSNAAFERRIRSVEQVIASLEAHERREGKKADLLTYLNRLSLDSRDEEEAPSGRKVSLMTLHAAKGLEFRLVFLIGMEEELLPHSGMQGEPQNLEEERRLCYVGMTRARERLVLTYAATRLKRGKAVPRTPSRFLDDIPKEWLEVQDLSASSPTPAGRDFFARLKDQLKGTG